LIDSEPPQIQADQPKGDFYTAVKAAFPDSSEAGAITPSILPDPDPTNSWSAGLVSDISQVRISTPKDERNDNLAKADISTTAVVADSNLDVAEGKLVTEPSAVAKDESTIDAQADAVAAIISSQIISAIEARRSEQEAFNAENIDDLVPDVPSSDKKPVQTTTNTLSHVSQDERPILTTTNSVPHVPFDQPVEPTSDPDEDASAATVEKRPQPQTKDSVLEITKLIPGGFV